MLQGNPCLCISLYINLKLLSLFFFWISVPCEMNVFQRIKEWFQIGKGVRQGCILLPCLFNLYTEYILRNTGLEEAQAGIKIVRRKINNLRYADDNTLIAESDKTRTRYHLISVRMVILKKSTNNKCWRGCGEKGTLLHC